MLLIKYSIKSSNNKIKTKGKNCQKRKFKEEKFFFCEIKQIAERGNKQILEFSEEIHFCVVFCCSAHFLLFK